MGFFKSSPPPTFECKLCNRHFSADSFCKDLGICKICLQILDIDFKHFQEGIAREQAAANSSKDPESRILHLRNMLDYIYEFKIKYYDNDVDILSQDIYDLINEVVDCISYARL